MLGSGTSEEPVTKEAVQKLGASCKARSEYLATFELTIQNSVFSIPDGVPITNPPNLTGNLDDI
jgi:hypothetical protein